MHHRSASVLAILLGLSACAGASTPVASTEEPTDGSTPASDASPSAEPCADWVALPFTIQPIDEGPLSPGVEEGLDEIAQMIVARPDILEVRALGLACPGSSMEQVALARAERVAEALAARGVPRERITTMGGRVTCGAYCSCCCSSLQKRTQKCSERCTVLDPPNTRAVRFELRVRDRGTCQPPPEQSPEVAPVVTTLP